MAADETPAVAANPRVLGKGHRKGTIEKIGWGSGGGERRSADIRNKQERRPLLRQVTPFRSRRGTTVVGSSLLLIACSFPLFPLLLPSRKEVEGK